MRTAALFVLSDVRSGSTLLDQCLGAHSEIVSLGELHWLPAYATEDRQIYNPVHPLVCSCGQPVADCSFWTAVAGLLERPLADLQLRPKFQKWQAAPTVRYRLRRTPTSILESFPMLFKSAALQKLFGAARIRSDSVALFDAACQAAGRRYCVDSSKSPFRFRVVYDHDQSRTRAIILLRDYRAVVCSKMKRGETLENAAIGWRSKMHQIDSLTADVPECARVIIKYEEFCENPYIELGRLCSWLGLELTTSMIQRPVQAIHHIGGSPSKFDPGRIEISLDRSYESCFGSRDLKRLRGLVGDVAEKWGY